MAVAGALLDFATTHKIRRTKMWKKIVAMALAVVVLLPLTACGEEELPSVQEIVGAVIEV